VINEERANDISSLPVIVTTRKDSWRYLGFKHVNGPATWGSYAKAQYIAHVHNEYGVRLEDIAAQIGDSNSTVQRMYRGLMIVEQAEQSKVFNRSDVAKTRFYFNYLYTGMDYPGISSLAKRCVTCHSFPPRIPTTQSSVLPIGRKSQPF
jgi:hypothetical protein